MESVVSKEKSQNMASCRIDWCDVYKGIVIILVVVGHATGKFNQYIYQFHMAAFFFISGYTANKGKDSVFEEVVKKFYKLKVPFYVIAFVGISLFWIFQRTGVLYLVSTTQYPERFRDAAGALIWTNTVYCDWLGAIWFLPVLFLASILFKILIKLCRRAEVLAIVSIMLFLFSVRMALSGTYYHNMDLAGMAQAFMVMGYLVHKIKESKQAVWLSLLKAAGIGIVWYCLIYMGFNNTVDWPTKSFHGLSDLLLPVCGIWMTMTIAKILADIPWIKNAFIYLGRNSMGVMCFHFIGFKVAYLLLILSGQMKISEICCLTPPDTVKNNWWFLISAVAVLFSILFWKMIHSWSVGRVLLGGGSASKFYNDLMRIRVVSELKRIYDRLVFILEKAAAQFTGRLKKSRKFRIAAGICAIAGVIVTLFVLYDGGKVKITFPYRKSMAAFGEGWFPQNNTEKYRWIEGRARFTAYLLKQETLEITGYIPDSIENVSYISVKVNDNEIYREMASGDQQIHIQTDISDYVVQYGRNTFEIEMDGARSLKETDADQREFTALIDSIYIY